VPVAGKIGTEVIFMGILALLLLGVGVSMDAFAVSICKGLAMRKATVKGCMTCGIWFGGFQALMPTIGFFLGTLFAEAIQAIDHWVAFILLAMIGVNMLKEFFEQEEECCCCEEHNADLSVKTMFIMAVATSIDALAVGISLAMAGNVNIWLAAIVIGLCTFGFSAAGVKIGNVFGSRFEKKAQLAGGMILILLGVKILLEHLGILV
jgi:putative Mn2+ efflux pump MntP